MRMRGRRPLWTWICVPVKYTTAHRPTGPLITGRGVRVSPYRSSPPHLVAQAMTVPLLLLTVDRQLTAYSDLVMLLQ